MLLRLRTVNVDIRPIGPADFLGTGGFPMSHIIITDISPKASTKWEQAKREMTNQSDSDIDDQASQTIDKIKQVLSGAITTVNGREFDQESFFSSAKIAVDDLLFILTKILEISLIVFRNPISLKRDELIEWYLKAKTFGTSPIKLLVPSGNYTALDAYMFDNAVQYAGMSQELESMQEQAAEIRSLK